MSHFSQIKTQLRSLPTLKAALTELGFDWKEGPCDVRGYQGMTQTAQVVIEQDNGYDIGFVWNGQSHEIVTDLQFWNQNSSVDRFLKQITQRYAYKTILQETAQQNNSPRLTTMECLIRWMIPLLNCGMIDRDSSQNLVFRQMIQAIDRGLNPCLVGF
jgi:Protein of unknown function (DUF1257)